MLDENDGGIIKAIARQVTNNDVDDLKDNQLFLEDNHDMNIFINEINDINEKEIGLIHIAAYNDALETIMYLVNYLEYNINLTTDYGYHALHLACLGRAYETAVYILNNIEINDFKNDERFIKYAVQSNSPEIVELLVKRGFTFPAAKNILKTIIMNKSIAILKLFLQQGQHYNVDCLITAIEMRNEEMFDMLIESNDDLDLGSVVSNNKTLLTYACYYNNEHFVNEILTRTNKYDLPLEEKAQAAVHWACYSCNPRIVKMLCEKDIDVNRLDDKGHCGPYYMIDRTDSQTFINILHILVDHGFQLDVRDNKSLLAEVVHSVTKDYDVICWLLKNGANPDLKLDQSSDKTIKEYIIDVVTQNKPYSGKFQNITEEFFISSE